MLLRGCGVAQVIEHLPSKHEALSSNSSTTHTKKCSCEKALTPYLGPRVKGKQDKGLAFLSPLL
jgi:hypothetical protein